MKIAFDAQLLFEKQKTGIGRTVEHLLKNMNFNEEDEYTLNYFSIRHRREKRQIMKEYANLGYHFNSCDWLHNVIYRRIWKIIPIPYSFLFGNKNQITQFFNYDIPPGIHGIAVTFIYDMVYKAYPETIQKETLDMLNQNLSRACDRADHIITISEFSKSEIIKYMNVPENKISVLPLGVDHSRFHANYSDEAIDKVREKYNIPRDYILYLGTLEPRKNVETLVEAYSKLKEENSDFPKLVLAGKKGWMYDTIFEKVNLLHLNEEIIFTGYVDSSEVPLLLGGAMVFVFPSLYEGFGLPPLEAMACGTPVITSNAASLSEVVGDAGILIDPHSAADIMAAIKQVIYDDVLRCDMRKSGILRSKEFTWQSSTTQLISIYNKLLG